MAAMQKVLAWLLFCVCPSPLNIAKCHLETLLVKQTPKTKKQKQFW